MKITLKKALKYLSMLVLLVVLAGGAGTGFLIHKAYQSLPDVERLVEDYNASVPTVIYDSNGEVIDLIYREIREEAGAEEIPAHVKNAFVAIEDRRFYSHYGLDPIRLLKAAMVNISQGRSAQGGSTLTQQLAKNAFLSHEKRLMRKVKEALITIEIERKYTKEEILQKYLNEIYFGSGAYGIKTAAQSFFGKDVSELNLAEAAMLAGIPNRPNLYNPRTRLNNAIKRETLILNQMYKFGFIGKEELDKALAHNFINEKDLPEDYISDLGTSVVLNQRSQRKLRTPDFTDIVQKQIFSMYDENLVYEGGLKVYTTLDLQMQKAAQETFREYKAFKDNKDLEGAMITMDSSNGHIKSIIGGRDFKEGNFNRAIMAKRQPGSAFKPFVYFTALQMGYPMNYVVEDSKVKYGTWEPRNYGKQFRKNFTILEGMERSINIVAIKVLQEIGIKNVKKVVDSTGVKMNIPNNLTTALGTMDLSPYDLATAYLPFSNGGYKVDPVFITRIEDRYGKVIYENPIKREKVFESEDVSLIVHMMKDVVTYGSGRNARVKGKDGKYIEQGGKTGTTNEFRTAWFAGITPNLVTVLYVGKDDNTSMEKATGGSIGAPLWGQYYQKMVDEDIYLPGKFTFIEEHLKNGDLVEKKIDSRSGLISDNTSSFVRKALFKRWQLPVEENSKYSQGLEKFFRREEMILDRISPEELENIETDKRLRDSNDVFNELFDR
ncbi:penicillin-binding protein [Propionigenium maris DSM 9537]|uniref:Penicillin-binding protein n=1 Tax=Propionigenium maris DSM 9537 TaxID=1123000 RepID=A0A9W6GMQ5_9FUSO|nr:PBP1A family penicillin-binding protein [Propionigenium maris]GLI57923.1 penicillin-binding protein [Propionigenium maris DSM 9537]